jgi:hypothetical protein
MVGTAGLEPATPCSQGKCATRLRYVPTLVISGSKYPSPPVFYRILPDFSNPTDNPMTARYPDETIPITTPFTPVPF